MCVCEKPMKRIALAARLAHNPTHVGKGLFCCGKWNRGLPGRSGSQFALWSIRVRPRRLTKVCSRNRMFDFLLHRFIESWIGRGNPGFAGRIQRFKVKVALYCLLAFMCLFVLLLAFMLYGELTSDQDLPNLRNQTTIPLSNSGAYFPQAGVVPWTNVSIVTEVSNISSQPVTP
jgi:hypothetical protein